MIPERKISRQFSSQFKGYELPTESPCDFEDHESPVYCLLNSLVTKLFKDSVVLIDFEKSWTGLLNDPLIGNSLRILMDAIQELMNCLMNRQIKDSRNACIT